MGTSSGTKSQQQQSSSHAPPLAGFDWRGASLGLALMALITAIGPFTILLSWMIKTWCTRSRLDPADRWNSMRTFAWLFTSLTAVAILAFFVRPTLALRLWYLSPLHLLGAPDLLANLWLRWFGSMPLALALSFVLERGNRRTIRWFVRVKTTDELVQEADDRTLKAEQAAQRRADEQATLERARAEEIVRAERAAARRATARRRAAAALTTELTPTPEKRVTTKRDAAHEPTLWEQATPPAAQPAPQKPKPEKADLGDGSMDALL